MADVLTLIGFFTLALAISYGIASWVHALLARRRVPAPPEGCAIRVASPKGLLRSRFLGEDRCGWWIEAPVQHNAPVPFREGEEIKVQVLASRGVLAFRTSVLARKTDPCRLLVRRPEEGRYVERREAPRVTPPAPVAAHVMGQAAELIDVSTGGCRIVTLASVSVGDYVEIDAPSLGITRRGAWVVEVWPDALGGRRAQRLRVLFAEPLERLPSSRDL